VIKLYTNKDGIELWRDELSFWAWTEDDKENYDSTNIAFLVDNKFVGEDYLVSFEAELEFINE
jgi:hypothetical protein